ncbi:MAG: 30S ribosomal protein S4 [bacterium]|nr:30S ribosomal protein S4 [bacterium]
MARHTGPVCRLCRAEGTKLFLKGEKCNTGKCPIVKRGQRPGQHGAARHKTSEYGLRLREKQKARRFYGVGEKQFVIYYQLATRKQGVTGERLLQILETRLDNVIYRMGFAPSRPSARQMVGHGHIAVNGRRVDVPSFRVKVGDKVTVIDKSSEFVKASISRTPVTKTPAWLEIEADKLTGSIIAMPVREDIDASIRENLIVEYYSR